MNPLTLWTFSSLFHGLQSASLNSKAVDLVPAGMNIHDLKNVV